MAGRLRQTDARARHRSECDAAVRARPEQAKGKVGRLPGTAASAARLYWESFNTDFARIELDLPVGCSIFAGEIYRAPKIWADRTYRNLIYWNEVARGGHFAAFEQPGTFVDELRAFFALVR